MFSIFLIIHLLTGIICLVSGLFAMFSKKKKGKHTLSGEIYHCSYVIVFVTAIAMSILHWETSQYLFYVALFSYGLALLGYLAAKKKWKNWLGSHIGGLAGSYIGIVTATLVVNVHRIPVLNELPQLLFWFLPTIIGTPIIFIVGKKYSPPNV
ncbi:MULTISPECIES: DUF2306 domain-containing protein [unclassified Paenibacillus]|uniref:DUF2306 domain-containing protein n=1 Tax=unclassified Paenibacillus TaxID=185978 RepID=UPI003632AE26